ncbi:hypothetical protein H4Q26_007370 [Puccinia striiformis f. sp. tritici PST-130]|nr:hypothetical protein H4Q26_007370 [Puccinia striiformis f. sp. tritici PST-130]
MTRTPQTQKQNTANPFTATLVHRPSNPNTQPPASDDLTNENQKTDHEQADNLVPVNLVPLAFELKEPPRTLSV